MSGERPELKTEGKQNVKPGESFIIIAFGAMVILALATCPYEDLASFNPLQWLTDSINGFINLLKDLFFGWIP